MPSVVKLGAALAAALLAAPASALDWSDNAVGYRYGRRFAEPYIQAPIAKQIFNLSHTSGYRYGSNFLSIDWLLSDQQEPDGTGSSRGAREVYLVYRHTLDLGKLSQQELHFGPVRGLGLTLGVDLDTKSDAGYNSRKRMLVAGPTFMMDVPGFFNLSLLALWESNAPYNDFSKTGTARYHYRCHPALDLAWAVPVAKGLSFEGYADFIAAKGKDEFGNDSVAETHLDMQLMADLSPLLATGKNAVKVGVGYEWWKNKFGNDHHGPAGIGAFARTPMLRAEFHF